VSSTPIKKKLNFFTLFNHLLDKYHVNNLHMCYINTNILHQNQFGWLIDERTQIT